MTAPGGYCVFCHGLAAIKGELGLNGHTTAIDGSFSTGTRHRATETEVAEVREGFVRTDAGGGGLTEEDVRSTAQEGARDSRRGRILRRQEGSDETGGLGDAGHLIGHLLHSRATGIFHPRRERSLRRCTH